MPNSKQKQASAPADAPVPAFGLSNEQLRRLSEAVVSSIESRTTVPSKVNIPATQSDPFEPEPGISFWALLTD